MSNTKTLVVSYCFPPYSDTAAIVAAKRVLAEGARVDVICNAMDSIRKQDTSLTRICGHLVDRFVAVNSHTGFSSWNSITAYVDAALPIVQQWEADQGRYERFYSRAQFSASHFLAARLKTTHPEAYWRAEFSDPLSHDVLGEVRESLGHRDLLAWSLQSAVEAAGFDFPDSDNLFEWCEVSAFALADEIVFTNELQRDFMISHCPRPLGERVRQRAVVEPHPTLPREYYGLTSSSVELSQDRVNIGYFGNFYANRGIGSILAAMESLPKQWRERLLLHVFTSKPNELLPVVRAKSLEQCVQVSPYVDYYEFLNLCDRMDLLLITDAITPSEGTVNPFLPSKYSDYIGSTTPIWGVVEEGSTLDRTAELAYRSPVLHFSALQAILARLAQNGSVSTQ